MITRHSTVPTLLVAIDISKHRHKVLIGIPGKKRRRRLTVMNTLDDFQHRDALLAAKACQDNADPLFRAVNLRVARRMSVTAFSASAFVVTGFLLIFAP